jgi:2-keto-4-pentenoate hydratase
MFPVWEDARVTRGMQRQLYERRTRIDGGARAIGWKVALGAPAAMAGVGISAPVVGFLTDATRLDSGASFSIAGTVRPVLEAEIAVHMGRDLAGGASREQTAGAIAALGPAIELADVDVPPSELEDAVAGDLYHRAVIVGPTRPGAALDRLHARVRSRGELVAEARDTAIVGDLLDVVAHVAAYVEAFGLRVCAGDVIITGSLVPLVALAGPARYEYELAPLGAVSVEVSA